MAILDDTFQDTTIDFPASIGSDHAGLWTTYQHVLELAIAPPSQLSQFIIADDAQDQWSQHFIQSNPQITPTLSTITEVENEAEQLTQNIELTSMQTFKARKGYSLRGLSWWNNECDLAAVRACKTQDLESCKVANKALRKEVSAAKRNWANKFLHNATPERLWTAAKWHFGHQQRLIPALLTASGISDQLEQMTEALKQHFFKTSTTEVPCSFPDDPPLKQLAHTP
jgi:hypothetical protein